MCVECIDSYRNSSTIWGISCDLPQQIMKKLVKIYLKNLSLLNYYGKREKKKNKETCTLQSAKNNWSRNIIRFYLEIGSFLTQTTKKSKSKWNGDRHKDLLEENELIYDICGPSLLYPHQFFNALIISSC